MGFCCKMNNLIDLAGLENVPDCERISNVGSDKCKPFFLIRWKAIQISDISCISQTVESDNLIRRVAGEPGINKITANKPGRPGNQKLHSDQPDLVQVARGRILP